MKRLIEILLAADTDYGEGREYEDCVHSHSHYLSERTRAELCKLLVDVSNEETEMKTVTICGEEYDTYDAIADELERLKKENLDLEKQLAAWNQRFNNR